MCVLSAEAPISKGHLITHGPEDEQLVFIKCQYVARAVNERGIMLPQRSPNH